jgi:hypothetical protein
MKREKLYSLETSGGFKNRLDQLLEKHNKINKKIEEGKSIDPELSKNFVSFPLPDNSYKG